MIVRPAKIDNEETYFRIHAEFPDGDPSTRFGFRTNGMWAAEPDPRKKFAIRKCFMYQPVQDITMQITTVNAISTRYTTVIETIPVREGSNILEKLYELVDKITNSILRIESSSGAVLVASMVSNMPILNFWLENGTDLIVRSNATNIASITIYPNLQKYLNQATDGTNRVVPLTTGTATPLYSKVWDRQQLFMHSTFSLANEQFVCQVGEVFQIPNKEYIYNRPKFDVWFTLDGKKPIFLLHDNFMFEIAFKGSPEPSAVFTTR